MDSESFREAFARSHSTHAKSVEVFLENSIMLPRDASEEAQKAELDSESCRLRVAFLNLAKKHCEAKGLAPGSDEALIAFAEANNKASSLIYAYEGLPLATEDRKKLSPSEVKQKLALLVPPHVKDLVSHVKETGNLGAMPDSVSGSVGDYVKGRFKSPEIDRVLAKILTQVEIVAYIDDMICKSPLSAMSKLEEAKPPSVFKFIWNVSKLFFGVWLVAIVIAASPIVIPVFSYDTTAVVALGLGTVISLTLLVLLVIGVISIIKERPRRKKNHTAILDMIARMNGFYLEFQGSGPFSLSRFKQRVNELADAGVAWPGGLFVLIEDMDARDVRTF
jgi:hypothetical protein